MLHTHCIVHIVTLMIFPKGVQRLGKRDLEERMGGVKLKFHQKKHPSPKVPPNQIILHQSFTAKTSPWLINSGIEYWCTPVRSWKPPVWLMFQMFCLIYSNLPISHTWFLHFSLQCNHFGLRYNSSLFAYGQTGSGKSWSVFGYGINKGIS